MRPLIWIILFIFICPQPLLGLVLERGQASICTQHRTLRSEVESFESTQRETDTIFSLWQDSINYGRLEGKFVLSNIDGNWEEGSYTLGIKDFWITNKIGMNTFLGDNNLYYRTIPVFFTNYQIPLAFLRGISSKIGSDRWNTQIIAGKLLERKGITGNAFEQTHESLYGLKFGLELPRKSFLGGGFLRTEGEEDTLGKLIIKKNNLFLLDARLGITDKLGILGEYLYSQYDSVEKGRVEDSSLIVGPFFKKEGLSFQANYRNLGRDFHFIGRSYQTATNQEGVYVDGDIRLKKIYLYGSTDYYWDDPGPEIERNRLFTWASNLGASFYPRQNWYFNLTSSVIKKRTSDGPNPVDDLRYEIFSSTSAYFARGTINPYLRFRYREDRTEQPMKNIEKEPDGIVGLNWRISRRWEMECEAEVRNTSNTLGTKNELTTYFDSSLRWQPFSRLYLSPGVEYIRTYDRIKDDVRNELAVTLGYGHQLHRGWRISANCRYSKTWGFNEGSYLDIFVTLEKVFHWGHPHLRLGVPKAGQKLICGKIKGYMFVDENGDKEKQPWEKGIPDIPIILDGRFVSVTDIKGEFSFENVLIGKHILSIEMRALSLEYSPIFTQQEAEVKVRKTTEILFPARLQPS